MNINDFVVAIKINVPTKEHESAGYLFNDTTSSKSLVITSKHSVCIDKNTCTKVEEDINSCRMCEISVNSNNLDISMNGISKNIVDTFLSVRADVAIIEISYEKGAFQLSTTNDDTDKYIFWYNSGNYRCFLNRPTSSNNGLIKYNIDININANLKDKEDELQGTSGSLIFKETNPNSYYPIAILTEDGGINDIGAELLDQKLVEELNALTSTTLFESVNTSCSTELNFSLEKKLKLNIIAYYKNNFNNISLLIDNNKKDINKNYINLNIVDVDSENSESVTLKQLIKNSTINNSTKALIYGKAGTGKSTLCQYITQMWATKSHYQEFEYVIYIALRDWKKNGIAYAIQKKYYELDSDVNLVSFIHEKNSKILFLFDGYDELINEKKKDLKDEIEKYSLVNYILTTRSYGLKINEFDVFNKFETVGFSNEAIHKYINSFFLEKNDIDDIKHFLSSNNNIREIVHNPLILEIICSLWKEDKIISFASTDTITMTLLYENIIEYIFYEYTENNNTSHIQSKQDEIFNYLGKIALNGLISQTALLDKTIIGTENSTSREFFSDFVLKAGFLRSDMRSKSYLLNSYQFLHFTFQEFFAAHYVSRLTDIEIQSIIKKYKFNTYMQVFFTFLAGLIKNKKILFDEFHNEPRDLLGFNISILYIDCLNELNLEQRKCFFSLNELSDRWLNYSKSKDINLKFIYSKLHIKDNKQLKTNIPYFNTNQDNDEEDDDNDYIPNKKLTYKVLVQKLSENVTIKEKVSVIEKLLDCQRPSCILLTQINKIFKEYIKSISKDISYEVYHSIKLARNIYKFNTKNKYLIKYIVENVSNRMNAIEYEIEIKDIMYLLDPIAFYTNINVSIVNLLVQFISMDISIKYKIDIAKGLYLNGKRDKVIIKILLDAILHSNIAWNESYDIFWKEDIIGLLCTNFDLSKHNSFSSSRNITDNTKTTMNIDCFIKYINEFSLLEETNIFVNSNFIELFTNAFILDNRPLFIQNDIIGTISSTNNFTPINCNNKKELLSEIEKLIDMYRTT